MSKDLRRIDKQRGVDSAIQAQLSAGLALYQQGRLADAQRIFEDVVRRKPGNFDALRFLGLLAYQNRAYERAVEHLSKAISANPNIAAAYFECAIALQALGRFKEARARYDKAIALKPDFVEAYYNRGNILRELGLNKEALDSYEKAIALKPDFADAYSNRGSLFQQLLRFEEAVLSYDKAVSLKPDFLDYYNKGLALKALKRSEEALSSFDKAIALKPNFAEAYADRGVALKELHRLDEALVSFDKAVALKPSFAEAHYNRALALKELKRLEEALLSYDRAVALKPHFADAHYNRGNALTELLRFNEALSSYDRAVALKPDFAEAHSNRGNALTELARFEEALESYDQAIARRPDYVDGYNNKGAVLKELGRFDEARTVLRKAIEVDPLNAKAYLNLADSQKFAQGDQHLAAMEMIMAKPDALPADSRMQFDFALGKAYADLKDHRRSFQHFIAGNAGKRATISYDEESMFAWLDRIESIFTRELIDAKRGGGDPSPRPIFIIGMPRSGSTLIEQILASHPMVHGAGELETLNTAVSAQCGADGRAIPYPEFVPAVDASGLARIGERYLALLNDLAPQGERVTDKALPNFRFAGLIHLALPKAKMIHAVRGRVDTCISCFSKLFATGQEFTYDLGELGRYYKRYERLMAHWRRVLPEGSILDVPYENVVADLETQARRILDYCGLPWDERCLSFHETERPIRTASATQVRQPIYRSAVGRGRAYEELLDPLLTALGVQTAGQF